MQTENHGFFGSGTWSGSRQTDMQEKLLVACKSGHYGELRALLGETPIRLLTKEFTLEMLDSTLRHGHLKLTQFIWNNIESNLTNADLEKLVYKYDRVKIFQFTYLRKYRYNLNLQLVCCKLIWFSSLNCLMYLLLKANCGDFRHTYKEESYYSFISNLLKLASDRVTQDLGNRQQSDLIQKFLQREQRRLFSQYIPFNFQRRWSLNVVQFCEQSLNFFTEMSAPQFADLHLLEVLHSEKTRRSQFVAQRPPEPPSEPLPVIVPCERMPELTDFDLDTNLGLLQDLDPVMACDMSHVPSQIFRIADLKPSEIFMESRVDQLEKGSSELETVFQQDTSDLLPTDVLARRESISEVPETVESRIAREIREVRATLDKVESTLAITNQILSSLLRDSGKFTVETDRSLALIHEKLAEFRQELDLVKPQQLEIPEHEFPRRKSARLRQKIA